MASEHDRSGLILAGVENSTSLTGLLHHLQRERGRERERTVGAYVQRVVGLLTIVMLV